MLMGGNMRGEQRDQPPPLVPTLAPTNVVTTAIAAAPQVTLVQRAISAMMGSMLTSFVVTPLDVVKVRLQAQSSKVLVPMVECSCGEFVFCTRNVEDCLPANPQNRHLPPGRLNGTLDGLISIIRHEGAGTLWRGLSPTLLMSIPATVIYFVGYETLKERLEVSPNPIISGYAPFVSGIISRIVAATVVSPVEMFKTKLQFFRGHHRGSLATIHGDILAMVRRDGLLTLWRGLSPTLWRDVPFSGIYWMGYEYLKHHLTPRFSEHSAQEQFLLAFLCGAGSGAAAAFLTTPFDVAKTRRQIEIGTTTGTASTPALLQSIVHKDGWTGLFKGLVPRVLRTAPACAIMIGSYEVGKRYFARYNEEHLSR